MKIKFLIVLLMGAMLSGCYSVPTYNEVSYTSYDELSSEAQNWGFVRKKGAAPDVDTKQVSMLGAYDGYYMDTSGKKVLYLTFDEGYENGYTSKILDVLAVNKVSAAFFVTGPYLEKQADLICRMRDEGHIIGNHTVNHINMANSDAETVKKELSDLDKMCSDLYGVKMEYVRPPEGTFSEKSLAISRDMGYKTILWSFAYCDWDVNKQQGAKYAYDSVVPYLHDGAIILLHAVSSDNAQALDDIIKYAKKEGYQFRSLRELE